MNFKIDKKLNTPAYIQVYNFLKQEITSGVFPYGSKIPSKRIMEEELATSVITIEHALTLLCDEGYIESKERSGYFVIYQEKDFTSTPTIKKEKIEKPLPYDIHSTSEFPYTILSKTMRKILNEYGPNILIKSPNHGVKELRYEISEYLKRSRNIFVEPSQVIVGSGSEYLYGLIAQLLKGNNFAIEKPSYDKIRKVYSSFGINYEMLDLTPNGISSNDLLKTQATVLHVTPFNSYPSGISINISKKKEYINWVKERDGVIIEDNYDSELTVSKKEEDSLFSLSENSHVIYINTFSETIAPSMRIGYMLLPKDYVEVFNKKLGFYSCTVPLFEQYVIAELLRSGDFERHINRIRRKKRKNMI